ncbi:MAG: chemotaxis protein CheW [Nitrospirota bacterium]|uniref:Chemotaxis protein CheW n=1 Tax=Candidatus Magnetominusculus xianensis TaxID=1748249 RepID=A0ABR5SJ92_9BACT|nr:chemotaxis protein CheW [Candidatus Magnetominusculus xianensis]KWT93565.1 chemotaxis protein CheW [Candidatus Magnetominusculus xianensis]MBF0405354.1 chemotaxis protein CheW [Nitrospirota bacterium]
MAVAGITDTTQYLTFILNEETFAIDISKVREVLEYSTVTKVPQMPSYMDGVINIRGSVVPVVDLSMKFGMREFEKTVNTCVIIVEIMVGKSQTVLGAVVDSVQEVMELEADKIEPPPSIGTSLDTSFIKGMGKRDERFIIILNIDNVFSSQDMAFMRGGDMYEEDAVEPELARN